MIDGSVFWSVLAALFVYGRLRWAWSMVRDFRQWSRRERMMGRRASPIVVRRKPAPKEAWEVEP